MTPLPRSHIAVKKEVLPSNHRGPGATSTPAVQGYEDLPQDQASYTAQREALIATEKQRRFDALKRVQRTLTEERADRVVQKLKEQESSTLWNSTDAQRNLVSFKGASWAVAKACGATEGALYGIIERMPKGAVLHCHLDGTTDAAWLIARATRQESLYMRASHALSTHGRLYDNDVEITFRQLPKEAGSPADAGFPRSDTAEIWTEQYVPNTWVAVGRARQSFPYEDIYDPIPKGYKRNIAALLQESATPSIAAFNAFLFSLMTLAPLPLHLGVACSNSKVAWTRFQKTFMIVEGLMTHEIRRDYFIESFRTSMRDNISYVEARVNFFSDVLIGSDMQDSLTRADMVRLIEEALTTAQSELQQGKSFECKVIFSTLRFIDKVELRKHVESALELKVAFPNRIVGFDLVGWEDVGVALKEYVPELLRLRERAAELGIDLPLCLHAGETLGDGDAVDDNLFDAILLGTRRIGHGFSLSRHPILMEIARTRGICIESCPISSQMLGYVDSMAAHPLLAMLGHGLPVAISHDDPSQFLNLGLSPDFYTLLSASDNLDLTSIGVLARNSLVYSLVPSEEEKQSMLDQWDQQWASYVAWVASMDVGRLTAS